MGWTRFFRRSRWDDERSREIQSYIEIETDENMARGMTREEAGYAARRKFGNPTWVREEIYRMNSLGFSETLWQDLRYGVRLLRLNPGFALVAILSLALGIGANTAIFQLLDAVRLRTLPVENPQELVEVRLADRTGIRGSQESWYPALTNPIWERLRDDQQVFSGVLAWSGNDFNLAPTGEVRSAPGLWVSGDFFRVLGVRPIRGRLLTTADDRRGCGLPGAVISYSFWQSEFGGDPAVIGRKLTLDHHPVEIIGVTAASFFGLEIGHSFDVALPICSQPVLSADYDWLDAGTHWWLTVMGRLKPGESPKRATAQLGVISPGIFEATLPKNYPAINVKDYLRFKLMADPAGTGVSWLRDQYEGPLWLLLATAGLVLLIACANLANLLLARASARGREIAVRLALGALRGRLIRQLMAESLLLATSGAAIGLLLAGSLSRLLVSLLSTEGNSVFLDLYLDWRVLGFALSAAVLTCVLFGLAPALRATRLHPAAAMKAGGRGVTASRERFGLRRALVATQVSLSLVLLVGALLFSRSLHNLMTLDPGFQENGILVANMDLTRLNLAVARRLRFKRDLIERLRAVPGVQSAAEAGLIPLSGSSTDNVVWLDGSDRAHGMDSNFNWISADYFRTLGTPLLAGRDFGDSDTPTSPKVAIVNQAFARRLGLGANPVGSRFRVEATPIQPETVFEVVGVVKDTQYSDVHRGFLPIAFLAGTQDQSPDSYAQFIIRSDARPADVTPRLRHAMEEVSPDISMVFWNLSTMIREKLLPERLMATLSGFFGFLAVLLAMIGLYGVMSYVVVRRTNEIGIRMTLGADRSEIVTMILREAGILLVIGLTGGTALSLILARTARAMLFGLSPGDPLAHLAAVVVLAVVAMSASYLPAQRAARLDPTAALREE